MDDRTLRAWLDLLAVERLVGPSPEGVAHELGAWLSLLEPAAAGDSPAQHELFKLVALHARSAGFEERPASATVMRVALLQDALRSVHGEVPAKTTAFVRSLVRVAADSHALGLAERLGAKHQREIRDFSPVIRLADQTVVAFMLGPMTPELIDAITGRLLRECSVSGAKTAILDVFGAAVDDDRFHRTIAALLESDGARKLTLVLTGLRDVARTRQALSALGVDLSRLRFGEQISHYLADRTSSS